MLEKLPESVGNALRDTRAGMEKTVIHELLLKKHVPAFEVRSLSFENMGTIPLQYTADGIGISPPLDWYGVPEGTGCVALIVEDADSPTPQPLVHAITVSEGGDGSLPTGAMPSLDHDGTGVVTGLNSYLQHRWLPPDPPPGHGPHRYVFQFFALNGEGAFSKGLGRHELVRAVLEHTVAVGCLIGSYERLQRQKIAGDDQEAYAEGAGELQAAV
jgi:phosphatidylethanolamine-binding protein (PEBP) family uncharacterized protein